MSDIEQLRRIVRSREQSARQLEKAGLDASGVKVLTGRIKDAIKRLERGESARNVLADLAKWQTR